MAHAWKACWCNSLTSSNLVFSASRAFGAIRKPFFHAKKWLLFSNSDRFGPTSHLAVKCHSIVERSPGMSLFHPHPGTRTVDASSAHASPGAPIARKDRIFQLCAAHTSITPVPQTANRWKIAIPASHERNGTQQPIPPSSHNPQKRPHLPVVRKRNENEPQLTSNTHLRDIRNWIQAPPRHTFEVRSSFSVDQASTSGLIRPMLLSSKLSRS